MLFVGVFCGSDLFTGVCVCFTVLCIQLRTLVICAYRIFSSCM